MSEDLEHGCQISTVICYLSPLCVHEISNWWFHCFPLNPGHPHSPSQHNIPHSHYQSIRVSTKPAIGTLIRKKKNHEFKLSLNCIHLEMDKLEKVGLVPMFKVMVNPITQIISLTLIYMGILENTYTHTHTYTRPYEFNERHIAAFACFLLFFNRSVEPGFLCICWRLYSFKMELST